MTFKHLANCLDTSQITECYINSWWIQQSPFELIEFLRSLPRLSSFRVSVRVLKCLILYQLPQIVHLMISNDFNSRLSLLCSDDIDAFCRSFTHVQRLHIFASCINDIPQLLNRMKTISTDIIIRQPSNINNEEVITRECIERNTELRNFHYKHIVWNNTSCLWL